MMKYNRKFYVLNRWENQTLPTSDHFISLPSFIFFNFNFKYKNNKNVIISLKNAIYLNQQIFVEFYIIYKNEFKLRKDLKEGHYYVYLNADVFLDVLLNLQDLKQCNVRFFVKGGVSCLENTKIEKIGNFKVKNIKQGYYSYSKEEKDYD